MGVDIFVNINLDQGGG